MNQTESTIRPLLISDLPELKKFTDQSIGQGYYSMTELEKIYNQSLFISPSKKSVMCTLVLIVSESGTERIAGVRITYPPGQWEKGKGNGLNPQKWPHDLSATAYFQSLFVDPKITGQGLGKKLSLEAIKILKQISAKGIVCHSWKESPNNSSARYLLALGFKSVAEHPFYWHEVDYECTRCGKPCICTAEEMYFDLTLS
jgi:GNAT superfamily N-acetyltransferase